MTECEGGSKPMDLRPEVRAFADLMEAKLRTHDSDRGPTGWKDTPLEIIYGALEAEQRELRQALRRWDEASSCVVDDDGPIVAAVQQVASEAADVANFCMMLVDVLGGLPTDDLGGAL